MPINEECGDCCKQVPPPITDLVNCWCNCHYNMPAETFERLVADLRKYNPHWRPPVGDTTAA